jgi:aminopeptidase N
LWNEYNYGKDQADAERYKSAQGYIASNSENKTLVRFNYNTHEDVFDAVSYNKGGAILQMLRKYVGDSAFFKSLNVYLDTYKYNNAEAQNLRLVFEEVTGKDLSWFWNQWYYGSGHPKLDIAYNYDNAAKRAQVIVRQTQTSGKLFRLPVAVDVYNGAAKTRHTVWVENAADTFNIPVASKPDLINFDGDKILLAQKKENKTLDEYFHQFKYAGNYIDRREAIDSAAKFQDQAKALEILSMGMHDKFYGIRQYAIGKLDLKRDNVKAMAEPILVAIAKNDERRTTKAAAIVKLGDFKDAKYLPIFKAAANDSSYSVAGSALEAIAKQDSMAGFTEAKRLMQTKVKGKLGQVVYTSIIQHGDESEADKVLSYFEDLGNQQKFTIVQSVAKFIAKVKSPVVFKRGVDGLITFAKSFPAEYRVMDYVEPMLTNIEKSKSSAGESELAEYVSGQLAIAKK